MGDQRICTAEDCEKRLFSRGLCIMHYRRFTRHGSLERPKRPKAIPNEICGMPDCDRPSSVWGPLSHPFGICHTHYMRVRKYGDPTVNAFEQETPCVTDGCDLPVSGRSKTGLCRVCRKTADNRRNKKRAGGLVSAEQYAAMHEEQGGLCAICGLPETSRVGSGAVRTLAADHCHSSNAFRGLLCFRCNVGLGYFQDDPDLLLAAGMYLERSRLQADA